MRSNTSFENTPKPHVWLALRWQAKESARTFYAIARQWSFFKTESIKPSSLFGLVTNQLKQHRSTFTPTFVSKRRRLPERLQKTPRQDDIAPRMVFSLSSNPSDYAAKPGRFDAFPKETQTGSA